MSLLPESILSDPRQNYSDAASLLRKLRPALKEVVTLESLSIPAQAEKLAVLNNALDILGLGRLLSYEFDFYGALHPRSLPLHAPIALERWFNTFFLPIARATSVEKAISLIVAPNLKHCFSGISQQVKVSVPMIASDHGFPEEFCSGDLFPRDGVGIAEVYVPRGPFVKPVVNFMTTCIAPWQRQVGDGQVRRIQGYVLPSGKPIPVHPAFLMYTSPKI